MKYHSHGKLLITGEYLVLKGANALASPVNFGQSLLIQEIDMWNNLKWESYEKKNKWFECEFSGVDFEIIATSNKKIAVNLQKILKQAAKLNPAFLKQSKDKSIVTYVDFDLQWGLGSSSSLISNIAYWADVDPMDLHNSVSYGSGYDVVAARSDGPFFYQKTRNGYDLEKTTFTPSFKDKIFFIYLGNKQDSTESVSRFNLNKRSFKSEQNLISELSKHIAQCNQLDDFEYYIKEHELIMSSVLRLKSLKESRFSDLSGEIKSLGAWGGDFAMLTWSNDKNELVNYLNRKNIDTVFSFEEMIKTR